MVIKVLREYDKAHPSATDLKSVDLKITKAPGSTGGGQVVVVIAPLLQLQVAGLGWSRRLWTTVILLVMGTSAPARILTRSYLSWMRRALAS